MSYIDNVNHVAPSNDKYKSKSEGIISFSFKHDARWCHPVNNICNGTQGSEFVDVTGRRRKLSMGEAPLEDLVQVLVVAEVEAGLGHRLAARQHDLVQPHDVLSQQRDNSLLG